MAQGAHTIKLPVSCLADFITGNPRSPESKLRPFKFRTRGEGFARTSYYQAFLAAVRRFHSSANDLNSIQATRLELQQKYDQSLKKWEQAKAARNLAAIDAYIRIYGQRRFNILPNHRIYYRIGPLVLTAQPDLWVEENNTQILLKVGVARKNRVYRDILLTVIRKAAVSAGYKVRAKNVVYLDVSSGREYICTAGLTDFNHTFLAAANLIAKVWMTVKPERISVVSFKRDTQPPA